MYKQLLAQQETSEPLLVGSPVASIESGEQKGLTHVTIVSPLSQAGQSLVYGVVPGLVTRKKFPISTFEYNTNSGNSTFALSLRNVWTGLEGHFNLSVIQTLTQARHGTGAHPCPLVVGEDGRGLERAVDRLTVYLDESVESGVRRDVTQSLLASRPPTVSRLELESVVMTWEDGQALIAVV